VAGVLTIASTRSISRYTPPEDKGFGFGIVLYGKAKYE